jgi:general secretion pathway protein E
MAETPTPTASDAAWIRPLHPHLAPRLTSVVERQVREGSEVIDSILRDALQQRATDVHIDPEAMGWLIRFRIDGALHDVRFLDRDAGERVTRHLKVAAGQDISTSFKPLDARASHQLGERTLDLRLAFAPSVRGLKLAIRLLDAARLQRRIRTLGLSKTQFNRIREWMSGGSGAFLVTGPTGSGKTTTLYAVLHELDLKPCSVVTIEDPVEYQVDGITQMQVNAEHGLGLAEGLRSMLRLDPDYLLLGEIRDGESARTAIQAAASGRALLSTMHTRDAVSTVTALRHYGLSDFEISSTLEVVIAQRLVRRLCGDCSRPAPTDAWSGRMLQGLGLAVPEEVPAPRGCARCQQLGYRGRIGVFEIWRLGEADYHAIVDGADERSLRSSLARRHFRTLLDDGLKKIRLGLTSVEEVAAIGAPVLARRGGAAQDEAPDEAPGGE